MKSSGSALSAAKKNYARVINLIRPLAQATRRSAAISVRLIRAKAPSFKHQASSPKLLKHQATSVKPQAASVKLKPASVKLHDS